MFRAFSIIISFLVILSTPANCGKLDKMHKLLKEIKANTDPVILSITNLLNLDINFCINLVGGGCAPICVDGIQAGQTRNVIVGAACRPTEVTATIVSNGEECSEFVGGNTRSYTVTPESGTAGCKIIAI